MSATDDPRQQPIARRPQAPPAAAASKHLMEEYSVISVGQSVICEYVNGHSLKGTVQKILRYTLLIQEEGNGGSPMLVYKSGLRAIRIRPSVKKQKAMLLANRNQNEE
jgi:sRNA-binding regulator protein Hfq